MLKGKLMILLYKLTPYWLIKWCMQCASFNYYDHHGTPIDNTDTFEYVYSFII